MELFIVLLAGASLLTSILLAIVTVLKQDWDAPPTVTQTEWDEDQILVADRLNLVGYSKDTLRIHTQRTPNETVLIFNVTIWWPLFDELDTRQVIVWKILSAGNHMMIGGMIEL